MSERVPVAKIEMRDAKQESQQTLDLAELRQRRTEIIAALDRETSVVAERLVALVPGELQQYSEEVLHPASTFVSTILQYGSREDKIKEPADYGFEDKDDAAAKMRLLKEVWSGVIDVEIDDTSDWYVHVVFKSANQQSCTTTQPGHERDQSMPDTTQMNFRIDRERRQYLKTAVYEYNECSDSDGPNITTTDLILLAIDVVMKTNMNYREKRTSPADLRDTILAAIQPVEVE